MKTKIELTAEDINEILLRKIGEDRHINLRDLMISWNFDHTTCTVQTKEQPVTPGATWTDVILDMDDIP